jgi:peptidoglycan endopeptidase LytE
MAQQKLETNSPVPPAFEPAPTNTLAETAANPLAPAPAQAATKSYTVVPGDSFYKIARANGVPVKAVIDVNPGLDSAKLKVGQVLQLPIGSESGAAISTSARATTAATASRSTASTSKAHGHYVVKSGDTLDRIARTHRTTVQALKATSGLTSDRIAAGQTLKMPEARTAAVSGAQG